MTDKTYDQKLEEAGLADDFDRETVDPFEPTTVVFFGKAAAGGEGDAEDEAAP